MTFDRTKKALSELLSYMRCGLWYCALLYSNAIGGDVCKSRIHGHRDYRDLRLVPWFLAIAVNLCHGRHYHVQFRLLNGQFWCICESIVNICVNNALWLIPYPCRVCWCAGGVLAHLSGYRMMVSAARLSLISRASCVRQTDTASMWPPS